MTSSRSRYGDVEQNKLKMSEENMHNESTCPERRDELQFIYEKAEKLLMRVSNSLKKRGECRMLMS